MKIKTCTNKDLKLLATLNKQLIEDEKHDNKMNLKELEERMKNFIQSDYKAYLFYDEKNVYGYALINFKKDPLYLRQFFIKRNMRRKGIGTKAFKLLREKLENKNIEIEVLWWNKRAITFWKNLGFENRSIAMRLNSCK